jgi:MFS transporter, PAT family, beta-lactamase induction signal transducer AmpG
VPGPGAPPWVFLLLIAPFGMSSGFLTVTLAYRLDAAGVGAQAIAGLIALSYLPHTWKFAWAPLVDLTWQRKHWYLASTTLSAAGIVAMGWFGDDGSRFGLLTAVVLAGNVAVTLSGMSVEALMAHGSDDAAKGRAGGWFQAGNLGGQGLGGGLALWLVQERGFGIAAASGVLALVSLLCMLALRRCQVPPQMPGRASVALALRKLRDDLGSVVRSRRGLLAVLICFLPIGSGAASNLWPILAGDWHAGANTVALVNGVFGGLAAAAGCIAGGYLCDRFDRKAMYCLFGALLAAVALLMGLAERTESRFAVFALAYAFVLGMSYAGFSAVVLEAIGRGAAATKYSLLASLSNMPIAYVTWADGWAYARWGATAMLQVDAGLGLAGLLLFALIARGSSSSAARTASGTRSG